MCHSSVSKGSKRDLHSIDKQAVNQVVAPPLSGQRRAERRKAIRCGDAVIAAWRRKLYIRIWTRASGWPVGTSCLVWMGTLFLFGEWKLLRALLQRTLLRVPSGHMRLSQKHLYTIELSLQSAELWRGRRRRRGGISHVRSTPRCPLATQSLRRS